MKEGPREKILYVVTVQPDLDQPEGDYLSTVDVDPESSTFCQVSFEQCLSKTVLELKDMLKLLSL